MPPKKATTASGKKGTAVKAPKKSAVKVTVSDIESNSGDDSDSATTSRLPQTPARKLTKKAAALPSPAATVDEQESPKRKRGPNKKKPVSEIKFTTLGTATVNDTSLVVASGSQKAQASIHPSLSASYQSLTRGQTGDSVGNCEQIFRFSSALAFKYRLIAEIKEGEHAGKFAAYFSVVRPFDLMGLTPETRKMIFEYLFAPGGKIGTQIEVVTTTRKTKNKDDENKDALTVSVVRAKTFAEGLKNRVAILRVSKTIRDEAFPVLYANRFEFDNTTTMLNFLLRSPITVHHILTDISVVTFKRATAMAALQALGDCNNLKRLFIDKGVGVKSSPTKAAKAFFTEASHFLTQGPGHDFNILAFGAGSLTIDDGDGDERKYDKDEMEAFWNCVGRMTVAVTGPM